MKKFLVFLVAIITTVCIGVTFYQFAKNDEVIKVNTETIYINYGDKLSLDDIGFLRKEANKQTKINFNAGGDEVTSIIKFDEATQCYLPTSKGGATTIEISTTNRKYKTLNIDVYVGVGTEENPYYITNEDQLFDVCNAHLNENAWFKVVKDIEITKAHTPIGVTASGNNEFTGNFDGGYHTISNLKIESCEYAGLFAIIGAGSSVSNLKVVNATLEGEFKNVGVIAGKCFGTINKVVVADAIITNSNTTASNTGAVVGLLESDATKNYVASIVRTSAYTDNDTLISSHGTIGGLAGTANLAQIHACYTRLNLKNISASISGGLVGIFTVNEDAYIRESYSVSTIDSTGLSGNIVGNITLDPKTDINNLDKNLVVVGLYFNNTLNSFAGAGSDVYGFTTATNFAVNGKSTDEMRSKKTYIYYVNNSSNIVYWDNVWLLVDGEYPTLTFVSKFDDINLDDDTQTPNNPDDNTGVDTPVITPPDSTTTNAIIISNAKELKANFQPASGVVNGTYILNNNIDLQGATWTPVTFRGTFKSSEGNQYSISNFKIVAKDEFYLGFFYSLTSAKITDITFNGVTTEGNNLVSAGFVVGHIRGNVVIENVDVLNSKLSVSAESAGGIAGYVSNITKLEKCDLQNVVINNSEFVGGVVGYASEDTYIIACKLKNSNSISGSYSVGGIASVNKGFISKCSFAGTIGVKNGKLNAYFGGLVGTNYNSIAHSTTYAEIQASNTNTTAGAVYYIGGLTGYNDGDITYSNAYANEYSAKNSVNTVYIAGLSAYNKGSISYSVADVNKMGSINNHIRTAGLISINYGGKVYGCFSFGDLYGYHVAGIVYTNTNNGTIDNCMSSKTANLAENLEYFDGSRIYEQPLKAEPLLATYEGVNVAGVAYRVISGTVSNCLVNADLICADTNGWVAGFVGFMPYSNDTYGTISNCVANVNLNNHTNGIAYLDMAQNGLFNKKRTTGTISNSIILKSYPSTTQVAKYNDKAGSKSNYIIVTNEEIHNISTFIDPNNCNFDISSGINDTAWLFVNTLKIAIPHTFVDVFGYDIIGLG